MLGRRGALDLMLDLWTAATSKPANTAWRAAQGAARLRDGASEHVEHDVHLDHMLWLLDDALERARAGDGVPRSEPVEMRTLLAEIATQRRSTRLILHPAPWPIYVLAKRGELAHLLAVLIERALQNSSRTIVRLDRGTCAMVVHIDDDGPGVARSARGTLFDASTARTPSARALASTRKIARSLNGEITVSSSPEGGARFTVWLPTLSESEVEFAAAS